MRKALKDQFEERLSLFLSNIIIYKTVRFTPEKYFNILVHGMNEICKNPDLGKSYEYIRKDYFGYNQKSHIIFYRIINNETIEIIRILHQKMDLHNRIIGY